MPKWRDVIINRKAQTNEMWIDLTFFALIPVAKRRMSTGTTICRKLTDTQAFFCRMDRKGLCSYSANIPRGKAFSKESSTSNEEKNVY